jgi:FtsZ-interacting cell division protein YlmF
MEIPTATGGHQLLVFHARHLSDAEQIIRSVSQQQLVVLHTAEADDRQAQRLIDFACGGMEAIGAQVHRIDAETFLFAPALTCVQQEQQPGPLQAVA